MIKLIVLDFHGVLVKGDYSNVCKMLAKHHHMPWQDVYAILYKKYFNQAVLGVIPERAIYQNTFRDFGWKGKNWQEVHQYHLQAMRLNQTVARYAQQLQNRGFTVLFLTKNTPTQTKFYIKKFNLKRRFPHIVNTFDLQLPKASKETVDWICATFQVRPEEVIFCDDQDQNLVEPKKAGMQVILYKNFAQFKNKLQRSVMMKEK